MSSECRVWRQSFNSGRICTFSGLFRATHQGPVGHSCLPVEIYLTLGALYMIQPVKRFHCKIWLSSQIFKSFSVSSGSALLHSSRADAGTAHPEVLGHSPSHWDSVLPGRKPIRIFQNLYLQPASPAHLSHLSLESDRSYFIIWGS